jgi:hypothetical protein
MKLEILQTLYCGPDKTYRPGQVFTDAEEPIPDDLMQEVKAKSKAVKVLEWGVLKDRIENTVPSSPIPQISTPPSEEGDQPKPETKRTPRS